ncbi:hypothetical protein ScPMuIL_003027 [Solemya velum]
MEKNHRHRVRGITLNYKNVLVINSDIMKRLVTGPRKKVESELRYGFVPNGGRVYYTKRSQPPFLTPMVYSYYNHTGNLDFVRDNIQTLEEEYKFWCTNRTVAVTKDGQVHWLNRYDTETNTPRPESYVEDIATATGVDEGSKEAIYSNLASAAESGWDFSSRWFSPNSTISLKSIITKDTVPVDLNALLCMNEKLLSTFYGLLGNKAKQQAYKRRVTERQAAIKAILWNSRAGIWQDYSLSRATHRDDFYPSNIFPLFVGCYDVDIDTKTKSSVILRLKGF